jgi:hypothetical protein
MPKLLDRTGRRLGRLLVVERAPNNGKHVVWACLCDCGTLALVTATDLGRSVNSCGCLRRDTTAGRMTTHGFTTGRKVPRWYRSWAEMWRRCTDDARPNWFDYGGRGITVCDRWRDAALFHADMGEPPEAMSLDRIDPNGNYEPSNCRWADDTTQANNKRRHVMLTHGGKTMNIAQWSRETGVAYGLLRRRVLEGAPPGELFAAKRKTGPKPKSAP